MIRYFKKTNLRKIHFLDKQQRFVLQTIILTGGLLITQLVWSDIRFPMVIILAAASYILTAWSLKEDIVGIEWIVLFILPVFFTSALSFFYFLLPDRWISRLVTLTIFAVGTYAIVRAENIYNVAVERSIQLIRVAQTVGLLITLVVVFFSITAIYSLRVTFFQNMLLITPIIFALTFQSLWTAKLESKITKNLLLYSFIVSFCIAELVGCLSFWPIFKSTPLAITALFISSTYYCLVGIIQQYMTGRMFINTIKEYVGSFAIMFLLLLVTTKWG